MGCLDTFDMLIWYDNDEPDDDDDHDDNAGDELDDDDDDEDGDELDDDDDWWGEEIQNVNAVEDCRHSLWPSMTIIRIRRPL